MREADWYFDFVSPFSYLQAQRLAALPGDLNVTLRPVLFAGLLNHWGSKGPAEVPPKRLFIYRHVQWQAQRLGVPFKFPAAHPFNPLKALRLAVALGSPPEAIKRIFAAIWGDGWLPDTAEGWRYIVAAVGAADADRLIERPEVKAGLRANGERAVAAGVFGVPTFVIDGEVFWGNDATEMVIDYLNRPGLFRDPEMRRIAALPASAQRAP